MAKQKTNLEFQIEFDDTNGQVIHVFQLDGTQTPIVTPRPDLSFSDYTMVPLTLGILKPGKEAGGGRGADCAQQGYCAKFIAGAWRCVPC